VISHGGRGGLPEGTAEKGGYVSIEEKSAAGKGGTREGLSSREGGNAVGKNQQCREGEGSWLLHLGGRFG